MKFRRLGTMIDCSRNAVMKPEKVKQWIDILANLGYNTLLLYTEDTFELDTHPYFGHLRGRYTQQELKEIDDYAFSKGIELMPCIQTLAHLNQIFQWDCYATIRDCYDILLAEEEKTYDLIEEMFRVIDKTFRSKTVNIGMDEAHMLGRGQYLTKFGLKDRTEILLTHLERVSEIAKKYDLQLCMWGDMFVRMINAAANDMDPIDVADKVRSRIPDNVDIIYWDYYGCEEARYDRELKRHLACKEGAWFAGGLWSWTGYAPHNEFSIKTTRAALSACKKNGTKNVFFTLWGDDGADCSPFCLLPALYYTAQLAKEIVDDATIKQNFAKTFGISFDTFMLLDLPGTPNAEPTPTEWPAYPNNTEKYALFNDCFMGKMDSTIRQGDCAAYSACAEKLAKRTPVPNYDFLFETAQALCEVLAIKAELGIETRIAYKEGCVAEILPRYQTLLEKLEVFYNAYRTQWLTLNKPHGFDVQDIRLGGLIQRVKHCLWRLEEYAAGNITKIDELEEPVLNYLGAPDSPVNGPVCFNSWARAATANIIGV